MKFGAVKVHGHASKLIWIIILFDEAFKFGIGAKSGGYVVTNAEPLCVEFCNFVHCYIFVNFWTC
jgi:hypothetical protein